MKMIDLSGLGGLQKFGDVREAAVDECILSGSL
jgi:hypothetical protein